MLSKLFNNKKETEMEYPPCELNHEDCEDCGIKYPFNVKLDNGPLNGTASKIGAHILVSTGESDWKHSIEDEPTEWGKICRALDNNQKKLGKLINGDIRISGTNLENQGNEVTLIVLPMFLKFKTTAVDCVDHVTQILQVQPYGEIPSFAEPLHDLGFVLLCSHKTRDKRCGLTAKYMRQAFCSELRYVDLYRDYDDDEPNGIKVLYISHLGGHKYAANAFIYKRDGMAVLLGRLQPWHAKTLVEKTILNDEVVPEMTFKSMEEEPAVLPILLTSNQARPFVYRIVSRKNGLNLKSSALDVFASYLGKHFGADWRSSESEQFLDTICKKWKDENRGVFLEGDSLTEVIRNYRTERDSSTNNTFDWMHYFKGLNVKDTKKWKFNPGTHSIEFLEGNTLFGTAAEGAKVNKLRYEMLLDKLYRNEQFQPAGLATSKDSYSITLIKNMLGHETNTEFFVFGLLEKQTEGPWVLMDSSASIELEFSKDTEFKSGSYYPSGSYCVCFGSYQGAYFAVSNLGPPVAELREESIEAYGHCDFFGANDKLDNQFLATLDNEIHKQTNTRIVILGGDIFLDSQITLNCLRRTFSELELNPPLALILPGSFISEPFKPYAQTRDMRNYSQSYRDSMNSLADILLQFPKLCAESKIVLIPGPNDPWHSTSNSVLPFEPLPEVFTGRVERCGSDIWFASNPARLLYLSHEMVLFRNNVGDMLRKYSLDTDKQTADADADVDEMIADHTEQQVNNIDLNNANEDIDLMDDEYLSSREDPNAINELINHRMVSENKPSDTKEARRMLGTLLDQCHLSPFTSRDVPIVWSLDHALCMPQTPSSLVVIDPTTPPIKQVYNGCHAMNPGNFVLGNRAQFLEFWPSQGNYVFREV